MTEFVSSGTISRASDRWLENSFFRLMKNNPELWDEVLMDPEYASIFRKFPELRYGPLVGQSRTLSQILKSDLSVFGIPGYSGNEIESLERILNTVSNNSSSHPLRSDKTFITNFQRLIELYASFRKLAPEAINKRDPNTYHSLNPFTTALIFFRDLRESYHDLVRPSLAMHFKKGLQYSQKGLTPSVAIEDQKFIVSLLGEYLRNREIKEINAQEAAERLCKLGNLPGAFTFLTKFSNLGNIVAGIYECNGRLEDAVKAYENNLDFRSAIKVKKSIGGDIYVLRDYALKHGLADLVQEFHMAVIDEDIAKGDFSSLEKMRIFGGWDFSEVILSKLVSNSFQTYEFAKKCNLPKTRLVAYAKAAAVSDKELAPLLGFEPDIEPFLTPDYILYNHDKQRLERSVELNKRDESLLIKYRQIVKRWEQLGEQAFYQGLINHAVIFFRSLHQFNSSEPCFLSSWDIKEYEKRLICLEDEQEKLILKRPSIKIKFPGMTEADIANMVGFAPNIRPNVSNLNKFEAIVPGQKPYYYFTHDSKRQWLFKEDYIQRCQLLGEQALDFGLLDTAINWYCSACYVEPVLYNYRGDKGRLERLRSIRDKLDLF